MPILVTIDKARPITGVKPARCFTIVCLALTNKVVHDKHPIDGVKRALFHHCMSCTHQ